MQIIRGDDPGQKPMVPIGRRQIGKTYSVRESGRENHEDVTYINFEEMPEQEHLIEEFDHGIITDRIGAVNKQGLRNNRSLAHGIPKDPDPNARCSFRIVRGEVELMFRGCQGLGPHGLLFRLVFQIFRDVMQATRIIPVGCYPPDGIGVVAGTGFHSGHPQGIIHQIGRFIEEFLSFSELLRPVRVSPSWL